jgi:protein-disulfide isomerase
MTLHPAARLLIPAALFVILMAAPRRQAQPTGEDGPVPLVEATEPPPDVPLGELFHELAEPDATLTVVEFSDFGCPYCGQFERSTFPALRDEFVNTGKVRWRFVPFVLGMFPNGSEAMRAATCVAEQEGADFWAMHDTLFAKQDVWKSSGYPAQLFRSYAVLAGAEGDVFTECYQSARSADRVTAANALAARSGVRSTPTFFVNGTMVQGALPLAEFRQVLLEALR